METGRILFVLIFGGVGAVFAWIGCMMLLQSRQQLSEGLRATGKVVELSRESGTDGGYVYYPIFEFTDGRGRQQRAKGSVGSAPAAFKLQEAVPVLYNPQNPESAQIATFGQLWLFPVIFVGIGTLVMFIGVAFAVFG